MRAGVFRQGWSRLVLDLKALMLMTTAEMVTTPTTAVHVVLKPASQADFGLKAAEPEPAAWALPAPAFLAPGAAKRQWAVGGGA